MVTIRPEITYDKEKCGDPTDCLKCIRICPYCVLCYRPSEIPEPPNPPNDWVIISTFRVMCPYPACKLCVDTCPKGAIYISIPSG